MLFFSFGRPTDFLLVSLHLPLVISLCCFAFALISGNLLAAFKSPVGLAFAALSVWLVIDIPLSSWRGGSFELVTGDWAKSFALFVVTAALLTSLKQNARAIRVLAYAFLTAALLGLIYGRVQADGRFALSEGLYAGANEMAAAMVQGCIFWWCLIDNPARSLLKRGLSLLPLIPLVIVSLETASRAGILVLGVIVTLIFFHYSARGRVVLATIVIVGVACGVAAAPGASRERFSSIFGSAKDVTGKSAVASSEQRAFLLKRSLVLTLEHPLFGVGPGLFSVAENSLSQEEGKRGQWLGTHNTYTQISSECGIPALLFFLASLYFCLKELRAAEKIHRSIAHPNRAECLTIAYTLRLALISYAVFFCFEHIGYDLFYPAVAGVIVAFARASRALVPEQAIQLPRRALTKPHVAATR